MNNATRICNRYLKEVKRAISPFTSTKAPAFAQFEDSLTSYASEHPDLQYDELVSVYGTPEDIAELTFNGSVTKYTRISICLPTRQIAFGAFVLAVVMTLSSIFFVRTHSESVMEHYKVVEFEQNSQLNP